MNVPVPKPTYFVGLDLGQARDYSALAIVERHKGVKRDEPSLAVRHLHRYELGTPYPAIVADVAAMLGREPLSERKPTLVIDGTGCGAAVVDLFRNAKLKADLKAVLITGGDIESYEGGYWRIPKRDLVSVIQVGLQTTRLKIAPTLAYAPTLQRELEEFKVKVSISPQQDTYEAWREGTNDDLVYAVALAVWSGAEPDFDMSALAAACSYSWSGWR